MCVQTTMDSLMVSNLVGQNSSMNDSKSMESSIPVMDPVTVQTYSAVPSRTSYRLCRHFARGKCTWGISCRFSHDTSESVAPHMQWNYPSTKPWIGETQAFSAPSTRAGYGHEGLMYPDMGSCRPQYPSPIEVVPSPVQPTSAQPYGNYQSHMEHVQYPNSRGPYDSMYPPVSYQSNLTSHAPIPVSKYSNIPMHYSNETSYATQRRSESKDQIYPRSVQVQRWQHEPYAYNTTMSLGAEAKHGTIETMGMLDPPFANPVL